MLYKCDKKRKLSVLLLAGILFLSDVSSVSADTIEDRIAEHQTLPVETNEVENWPQGPVVAAESAILMEASTGAILYSKNIHKAQYPASTTKILTTLIASERCGLSEIVDFSKEAVFGAPAGSNNIAMDVGEQLTMEECLNAILIRSANEVSYAVAEHISGTWDAFADLMNERAAELGCVDSHFANPNGLPDPDHYTSAYDLAMIGRAFFANEMLCKITMTPMLHIEPSNRQPDDIWDANKMALLPGKEYAYEYLVGCKTGYTEAARSTLVSCAEKDGMRLICVVLNDENPNYYEDTIALFQYGFGNFDKINVSQTETKYNIDTSGMFYSDHDIFGSSVPILSLNKNACVILPKTADFTDTVSEITYETENDTQAALITYRYHDVYIGSVSVDLAVTDEKSYSFDSILSEDSDEENAPQNTSFVFINVLKLLGILVGIAVLIGLILLLRSIMKNYQFSMRSTRRSWRRSKRKRNKNFPKFRDYDR